VIQGFFFITKFLSPIHISLQVKMAQQGQQMRIGDREGFAYPSVKPGLLANGNRYAVEFSGFFSEW
jgi:hypothetical protein